MLANRHVEKHVLHMSGHIEALNFSQVSKVEIYTQPNRSSSQHFSGVLNIKFPMAWLGVKQCVMASVEPGVSAAFEGSHDHLFLILQ